MISSLFSAKMLCENGGLLVKCGGWWCGNSGLDCCFRLFGGAEMVVWIVDFGGWWCCCGVLAVWFLYDCVANGAFGNL